MPVSGNGIYTEDNAVLLESDEFSAGNNYFHLSTQDSDGTGGIMSHTYTIHVNSTPPTITSSTHSSQSTFYDTATVALSWTDPSGKEGSFPNYVYIWDRYATTTPTTEIGVKTDKSDLTNPSVPDGIWYLHVISLDTMGYPTKTARHFQVNVGAEPGKGNIAGWVKDADSGSFIGDATVTVNKGIWTDTTIASDGSYSFGVGTVYSNTEEGWPKWEVTVTKEGYEPMTKSVDVTADATTPLNFNLIKL